MTDKLLEDQMKQQLSAMSRAQLEYQALLLAKEVIEARESFTKMYKALCEAEEK